MPSRHSNVYVGIDFGTTNTVVSFCDASGTLESLQFPSPAGISATFRSVISYVHTEVDAFNSKIEPFCGQAAIDAFLTYGEDARLIQSLKTFVASKSFESSVIHGREFTLEKILADFLKGLITSSTRPLPPDLRSRLL